jgi:GTP-binding protein
MPGKTQALNFFTLDGRLGLVDFPGYGYAKVPQALRRHWGPMTAEYIEQRSQLRLMLLLIDIRRIPSGEDLQLIEWSAHHGIELVVVLTKVDKLKSGQRAAARQKIAQTLGVQPSDCVYYSSSKNIGRHELIQRINAGLRDAEARLATDQGGHNGTAA